MPHQESGARVSRSLLGRSMPAFMFLFFLAIFLSGQVSQVADSSYSMALSQQLLRGKPNFNGTQVTPTASSYQLLAYRDTVLYAYPYGSSILSMPFVAIANALGLAAVTPDGKYDYQAETRIERILSALAMAAFSLTAFLSARLLLSNNWSILTAATVGFGTQVLSTLSRVLWSDTWAVLLLGIALYKVMRLEVKGEKQSPAIVATLLSWAFFCKPTYILSVGALGVFMLLHGKKPLLQYVATCTAWFAAFLAFSLAVFGRTLPPYYEQHLQGDTFWQGLLGTIVSPGRGELTYSPFLILVILALILYRKHVRLRSLLALSSTTIVAQVVVLSCWPMWWGGDSYGSRLMSSVVPWIAVLTILGLKAISDRLGGEAVKRSERQMVQVALALFIVASVFVNAEGAFNDATLLWNAVPTNVNSDADTRLWDWTYPQFLAGVVDVPSHYDYRIANARPVGVNSSNLNVDSTHRLLRSGFSGPETWGTWSDGTEATLTFLYYDEISNPLYLTLDYRAFANDTHQQTFDFYLNGKLLARRQYIRDTSEKLHVDISGCVQRANSLTIRILNPVSPSDLGTSNDHRKLGIGLISIGIVGTDDAGLWESTKAEWAVISDINNLNGLETLDGKPFFWVGNGDTVLNILANQPGTVTLSGEAIPGPSPPSSTVRSLAIETSTGWQEDVSIVPGQFSIAVPVVYGKNSIRVSPLDKPVLPRLPNGDTRPLILGIRDLQLQLSTDTSK